MTGPNDISLPDIDDPDQITLEYPDGPGYCFITVKVGTVNICISLLRPAAIRLRDKLDSYLNA